MGGGKTVVQAPAPAPLPPAPDYGKTMTDTIKAQIALAPEAFAAESSAAYGQPAYAQLQNQVNEILASGQLGQMAKYYPQIAGIEADYMRASRANELAQLQSPEIGLAATQQAFNQLTPGYAEAALGMGEFAKQQAAMASRTPTATSYEQQVAAPEGSQQIAQTMVDQAQQDLAAGRNLTPEETRMATQAAREAYAARGTALGPQAIGAEMMARAELANQRLRERQQFAGQAAGLQSSLQNQLFQQALQRTQQGIATQQGLQGLQAGRAQMASGAMGALQGVQAPILQAFYKQPLLSNAVTGAQQFALAGQQAAGPALFNPESQIGFQTAYLPYQGALSQNIAQMQGNAMMQSAGLQANAAGRAGTMGMIGSVGGAALLGAGIAF
jgi:hypothetical protein